MSTKIYDAVISELSLEQLLENFKKEIPVVKKIVKSEYNRLLAQQSIELFDASETLTIKEAIGNANAKNQETLDSIKLNARVPYDLNFEYSVLLFPLENKTLMMFFCQNIKFHRHFMSLPYVSDYHYQNSSDKPENISQEDWNKRSSDWDTVLGGNGWGRPIDNGLQFTFNSNDVYFRTLVSLKHIKKAIPSPMDRKFSIYKLREVSKLKGEPDVISKVGSLLRKINKQYKSGELQDELNKIKLRKIIF
jgi:hypothetical protein